MFLRHLLHQQSTTLLKDHSLRRAQSSANICGDTTPHREQRASNERDPHNTRGGALLIRKLFKKYVRARAVVPEYVHAY